MALTVEANAARSVGYLRTNSICYRITLMTLDEYLNEPDAPTVTGYVGHVRARVKSDAQIRQWRYGYPDRLCHGRRTA